MEGAEGTAQGVGGTQEGFANLSEQQLKDLLKSAGISASKTASKEELVALAGAHRVDPTTAAEHMVRRGTGVLGASCARSHQAVWPAIEPSEPREEPVPAAACTQPGSLVSLRAAGLRAGEEAGQAHAHFHRLWYVAIP